jgi:hypothetical protein
MITGFNPADMYAVAHIRRVLRTFPGVFSGIGEFSIHKEFVSAKVAGEVASLTNPAVDSILALAGEAGLVVVFHNDMDMPFARAGAEPVYLTQMKALLKRHPDATIIWAHMGLGRIVHPVQASASASAAERNPNHAEIVEGILSDPALRHVYFDISWDEVAKYLLSSPEVTRRAAEVMNRYPDRFLFGSDVVAPKDPAQYFAVFDSYKPLWALLTPETSEKGAQGELRAALRRRATEGARMGASEESVACGGNRESGIGNRALPILRRCVVAGALLFFELASPVLADGQQAPPSQQVQVPDPLGRETPRGTVREFNEAVRSGGPGTRRTLPSTSGGCFRASGWIRWRDNSVNSSIDTSSSRSRRSMHRRRARLTTDCRPTGNELAYCASVPAISGSSWFASRNLPQGLIWLISNETLAQVTNASPRDHRPVD